MKRRHFVYSVTSQVKSSFNLTQISTSFCIFFLHRSSYKRYSIYEKYDMKTYMKSEMQNLGCAYFNRDVTLFRGFYRRQIFRNKP